MKKTFFTPGPAALYPTVDQHLVEALNQQLFSQSHRSPIYETMHQQAVLHVKQLMGVPEDFHVFFFSSATEIWERLAQNCLAQHSLHFVNGSFSSRFFDIVTHLGFSAEKREAPWGENADFTYQSAAPTPDLINFTLNETSTGVCLSLEDIYRFRAAYPEALVTLDMVSIAPHMQIDWSQVDAGYFSVQKCFGLPAGLGVLMVGPRAIARSEQLMAQGRSVGSYHSFWSLMKYAAKNQTPETPNILAVYLLGKVTGDMLTKGIDRIRRETLQKAELLYHFFEQHPVYSLFVQTPEDRSPTVIVVNTPDDNTGLREHLATEGLIVGNGYGPMKGKQLRIANFPAVSLADVKHLLNKLEAYAP